MLESIDLGIYEDDTGATFSVIEVVNIIKTPLMSGETRIHKGSKAYKTQCGKPLNASNDKSFTTLEGVTLKKAG
jgi:hypothetical protein